LIRNCISSRWKKRKGNSIPKEQQKKSQDTIKQIGPTKLLTVNFLPFP